MDSKFSKFVLPCLFIFVVCQVYIFSFFSSVDEGSRGSFTFSAIVASLICFYLAIYLSILLWKMRSSIRGMYKIIDEYRDGRFNRRFGYGQKFPEEIFTLKTKLNEIIRSTEKSFIKLQRQVIEKHAVLSSMSEGLVAVDLNEKVYLINEVALRLFGVENNKTEDGANWALSEVVRDISIYSWMNQSLKDKVEGELEFRVDGVSLGKESKSFYLHIKCSPIRLDNKNTMGMVFVVDDISKNKELEKLQKNFVGNVSHELKTPLTLMQGFTETLLDTPDLPEEERHRYLGIINKHSTRLSTLINDLLVISRLEGERGGVTSLESVNASLFELIQSAISLAEENGKKKSISFKIIEENKGLMLQVNRQLFEQAIFNLLINAIKYSSENSEIHCVLRTLNNGAVQIEIKDFGCGIEAKHLPNLFMRFYRADKGRSRDLGGTGLGLAIVKNVAQLHGAEVTVNSEINVGTSFFITFGIK